MVNFQLIRNFNFFSLKSKISAQPHILLYIQFLYEENNATNNGFPVILWFLQWSAEIFPLLVPGFATFKL